MKNSLFCLILLISNKVIAQTYYSEYSVIITDNKKMSDKIKTKDGDVKEILSEMFPKELCITFSAKIISNEKYAYMTYTYVSSNTLNFSMKDEEQRYFVDYSKNLCYDLKTKTYFYSEPNTVTGLFENKINNSFEGIIINGQDTVNITFDKTLPKFLTMHYFLKNNSMGISKIQTKRSLITLVKFQEQKFDIDKVATIFKNSCTKKTKDFNTLFLR